MAVKKSAPKRRLSTKKPLEKVEKDEPHTLRGGENPLKSAVALGIVAVLIGLTVGGYVALRYFESPEAETSVDEVRVNELAEQLAQRLLEEKKTLNPEDVRGYTQAVVPSPATDEAGNAVTPEPTSARYVNDYYGIAFEFPVAWTADTNAEVRDAEVHLAMIASNEVEMLIRVAEYDERSFKRAAQQRFTTEDEVRAAVEEKRTEFAQLFPDSIDEFSLSSETTDFGHQARSIDGHDAFVDWFVPPTLAGEPARVRRRFFVDNGRGTMFVVSMSFPAVEGVDVADVEEANPFSELLDVVMNTWRFTSDGIGDGEDAPNDLVEG